MLVKCPGCKAEDLPTMSSDIMASEEVLQKRRIQRLGGWEPLREPFPVLPVDIAWHAAATKRLVLVLSDASTAQAFERCFVRGAPRIEVVDGDITAQDGRVDAYVSPANTMGNMGGGVDRAYADHFGWSYGRPYRNPKPLQRAIDEAKGHGAMLPIGDAIVV